MFHDRAGPQGSLSLVREEDGACVPVPSTHWERGDPGDHSPLALLESQGIYKIYKKMYKMSNVLKKATKR